MTIILSLLPPSTAMNTSNHQLPPGHITSRWPPHSINSLPPIDSIRLLLFLRFPRFFISILLFTDNFFYPISSHDITILFRDRWSKRRGNRWFGMCKWIKSATNVQSLIVRCINRWSYFLALRTPALLIAIDRWFPTVHLWLLLFIPFDWLFSAVHLWLFVIYFNQ